METRKDKRWLIAALLRSLLFCIFIFALNNFVDLGTSPLLLCGGAVLSIFAAASYARSPLTSRGFFTILLTVWISVEAIFFVTSSLSFGLRGGSLGTVNLIDHLRLIWLVCVISGVSSWLFYRSKNAVTFETVTVLSFLIYLMSGHRNFHFEMPRIVNTLAWRFGIEPLTMLIWFGTVFCVGTLLHLFFVSRGRTAEVKGKMSRQSYFGGAALLALLAVILGAVSTGAYRYYYREALPRTGDGVGDNQLNFRSALGGTQQPAALVRLEGDYQENPFAPMLYLRENALSEFNGKELTSNKALDDDVPGTTAAERFSGEEHAEVDAGRRKITQSVYLLSDHNTAFAIDYPLSITPVKVPDTERFKNAYKAVSFAPSYDVKTLGTEFEEVGNPAWSPETRAKYLKTHSDTRYADLAAKIAGSGTTHLDEVLAITGYLATFEQFFTRHPDADFKGIVSRVGAGLSSPMERAFAITNYLSKNAIYTLTPNHSLKGDEDPVAPFLFGDLRGYCVHFAYSTVYMLRSLGIPSRIGMGYMTDLSQSKDGHILLRVSDRHAWAEVYVTGKGWIPFDTQPEQVESHADSQVDMKLLEELMGLLQPGDEILPEDIAKDEPNLVPPTPFEAPDAQWLYLIIALVGTLALTAKIYLRFGWALTRNPSVRVRRSYVALVSMLHDLGYTRREGETRSDFARRLNTKSLRLETTTPLLEMIYGSHQLAGVGEIDRARSEDLRALSRIPLWKRLLGFFNPSSLVAFLTRTRW